MEVVRLRVVVPQAADGVGYEWPARSAAVSPVTVIAVLGKEPAGPRGGVHNDRDADDRAQRRQCILQERAEQRRAHARCPACSDVPDKGQDAENDDRVDPGPLRRRRQAEADTREQPPWPPAETGTELAGHVRE